LITYVENDNPGAREAIKQIYKNVGKAHIIGITGIAGVGKSSLIAKMGLAYRKRGKTVGIIAVDPTSPLTGGALLGDRVRMLELTGDKDIFIRSMGTRGSLGGIATATYDVINIMDAFKKDIIIVESIGVGQDEIDIENFVQTLVIVTMPGGGDAVQSIKAGILEFGDIYVVNKSDRPEAIRMLSELEFMLQFNSNKTDDWEEKIVQTVATMNEGIEELLDVIEEHHKYLKKSGGLEKKRIKRSKAELIKKVSRMVENAVKDAVGESGDYNNLINKMAITGEIDPYSAAEEVFKNIGTICTIDH
jgi:GTPase